MSNVTGSTIYSQPYIAVTEPTAGSQKGSTYGSVAQVALTSLGAVLAPYTAGASLAIGSAAGQAAKAGLSTLNTSGTSGSVKKSGGGPAPVQTVPFTANSSGISGQISNPDTISSVEQSNRHQSLNTGDLGNSAVQLAKEVGLFDKISESLRGAGDVSGFGSGIDWSGVGDMGNINDYYNTALKELSAYSPYAADTVTNTVSNSAALETMLENAGLTASDWMDLFSTYY